MSELAKLIRLTRDGMEIDGQEFPWTVMEAPEPSSVSRSALTHVTVRIPCEQIVVEDLPWTP
jgi:hypothetical protein